MNADDLVTEVRARGVSTSQLSDTDLDTIIGGVLRTYNRYRPQDLASTITTVQYQGEYDVDADATKVLAVFWDPAATSDVISRVLTEMRMIETDFYYPSLLTIYHVNRSEIRKTTDGHWGMRGSQVSLKPVPTQDDIEVPYIYSANWELIEDVPASDEDLLVEGATAMASAAVAQKRAGSAGWRAGDYQVDGGSASSEVARANSELSWWKSRLAGGGVGSRS